MPGISLLLDICGNQRVGGQPVFCLVLVFFWSASPHTPCGTSVAHVIYLELVRPMVSTGKRKTFHFPDELFTQFPIIIYLGDIVGDPSY